MVYLFLALLFSITVAVSFRFFPKYKIDTLQAITINYFFAVLFGLLFLNDSSDFDILSLPSWFNFSLMTGFFMIGVFILMGFSIQKAGVAISIIASKMSVIIPVLFGFFLFQEPMILLKIIGLLIVIPSFYLIFKSNNQEKINRKFLILPLLLFIGTGSNDTIIKFAQAFHMGDQREHFLIASFCFSFILGVIVYIVRGFISGAFYIKWQSILAGFWLGLLNWFSTIFFIYGMSSMPASTFFPIFNTSLATLLALIGYFIFKEKLSKTNFIGIGLAIFSILLITMS